MNFSPTRKKLENVMAKVYIVMKDSLALAVLKRNIPIKPGQIISVTQAEMNSFIDEIIMLELPEIKEEEDAPNSKS